MPLRASDGGGSQRTTTLYSAYDKNVLSLRSHRLTDRYSTVMFNSHRPTRLNSTVRQCESIRRQSATGYGRNSTEQFPRSILVASSRGHAQHVRHPRNLLPGCRVCRSLQISRVRHARLVADMSATRQTISTCRDGPKVAGILVASLSDTSDFLVTC